MSETVFQNLEQSALVLETKKCYFVAKIFAKKSTKKTSDCGAMLSLGIPECF